MWYLGKDKEGDGIKESKARAQTHPNPPSSQFSHSPVFIYLFKDLYKLLLYKQWDISPLLGLNTNPALLKKGEKK